MAKKKIKWYDIRELFSSEYDTPPWQYAIIFSGRGLGKSYSTYRYIIDQYMKTGKQGMIIKRFESDMKGSRVSGLFSALEPYVWEMYQLKIRYWRGAFYLYVPTEDNKIPPLDECELFCYTGALNISDRLKGMNYPNVETIVFEEFMSMNCRYLPDEVQLLMNIVSTVFRHRTTGRVILLGNAISKYDPYSQALNLKLYQMEHGQIKQLTFKDERGHQTNFIIHRAVNVDVLDNEENKDSLSFTNFGNNGLGAMISSGEFQTNEYPHHIFGIYHQEISEKEYLRLMEQTPYLRDRFTENDNTNVYFKFNESYYLVRLKKAKTTDEFIHYNGNILVGILPVSESYFLNQGKCTYDCGLKVVISNEYQYIPSHSGCIVITNFYNYISEVKQINMILDWIRTAFANGTVCYLNNDTGQNVQNILTLQGGF